MSVIDEIKFKDLVDIVGHDPQLSEFASSFYKELYAVNSNRKLFDENCQYHNCLDTIARLVVGADICAAVAFDSDEEILYVATNKKNHNVGVNLHLFYTFTQLKGSTIDNRLFRVAVHFSVDDSDQFTKVHCPDIISYRYKDTTETTMVPDIPSFSIEIIHDSSTILPGPSVPISLVIVLGEMDSEIIKLIPLNKMQDIEFLKRFGQSVQKLTLDPVVRAVTALIKLLGLHVLVARNKSDEPETLSALQLFKLQKDLFRMRVFMNSMTIEIVKLFASTRKGLKSTNSENDTEIRNQILQFLDLVNSDYISYKQDNAISKMSDSVTNDWLLEFFEKNRNQCPQCILDNQLFFVNVAVRYYNDITVLEEFVSKEAVNPNSTCNVFINYLLNQGSPHIAETNCKFVECLDDGVHAEIRLLYIMKYVHRRDMFDYIATSLKCCAHCYMVFERHNVKCCGGHGRVYGNWKIDTHLWNDDFLEQFLGPNCFAKLDHLRCLDITIKGEKIVKSIFAKLLMQKISDFDTNNEFVNKARAEIGICDLSMRFSNLAENTMTDLSVCEGEEDVDQIFDRTRAILAARLGIL